LAELAAGRDDVAELQHLADEGNGDAANRLSDIIGTPHENLQPKGSRLTKPARREVTDTELVGR